jgi:hypothetical protein
MEPISIRLGYNMKFISIQQGDIWRFD